MVILILNIIFMEICQIHSYIMSAFKSIANASRLEHYCDLYSLIIIII